MLPPSDTNQLIQHCFTVIEKSQYECLHLPMTLDAWREQRPHFPRHNGLYIHIAEYKQRVVLLRIGMAHQQNGIHGRWFQSQAAHYYCFQHSRNTPNYHTFFQQIAAYFANTWLLCFLYPERPKHELGNQEKLLIAELQPIWEQPWHDHQPAWKRRPFIQRLQNLRTVPNLIEMIDEGE